VFEMSKTRVNEAGKQQRIRELEGKIVQVCVSCPHAKFYGGVWECQVSRRHCHSKRVRRWLDEIKKLEEVSNVEKV